MSEDGSGGKPRQRKGVPRGIRVPLPEKTGGPHGPKKGAKGYRRRPKHPPGKAAPEEDPGPS